MDQMSIKGYWSQKKEKLKIVYPALTDDDLTYHIDNEDEMIEKLQYKIGKPKNELYEMIIRL